MLHWLVAGGALIATVAGWRFVVKPLRRLVQLVIVMISEIRTAATGVRGLRADLHQLAGSVTQLAAAMFTEQKQLRDDHAWLREAQHDLRDFVIDLDADVRRLEKTLGAKPGGAPHDQD